MRTFLIDGYHSPFLPGQPHVIEINAAHDERAVARVTIELLDEDEETIVHWHVPCGQLFRKAAEFVVAQHAAKIIMQRREAATSFVVALPFDGIFRFTNTPTLFDPKPYAS